MNTISSMLSLTTTKVQMSFGDTELASGTGFFFQSQGRPFLITNRHNLTGRDQNTNLPLHSQGGLPNKLKFSIPVHQKSNEFLSISGNEIVGFELNWSGDARPWLEHHSLGAAVDIVAIDMQKHWPEAISPIAFVNSVPHSHPLTILPAAKVSVIGYPFGTSVNGYLPVWVTGSVASEPSFDVEGKPAYYIDCRTNKGASRSPVFLVNIGSAHPVDSKIQSEDAYMKLSLGDKLSAAFHVPVHRFLGIYSGRVNKDADVGLLWRESVIREICEAGIAAAPVF